MEPVPLHLRQANEFVGKYHRHSLPTVGCKFAVGAAVDGKLVGILFQVPMEAPPPVSLVVIAREGIHHGPDDG